MVVLAMPTPPVPPPPMLPAAVEITASSVAPMLTSPAALTRVTCPGCASPRRSPMCARDSLVTTFTDTDPASPSLLATPPPMAPDEIVDASGRSSASSADTANPLCGVAGAWSACTRTSPEVESTIASPVMAASTILLTTFTAVETPTPAPLVEPARLPASEKMVEDASASTAMSPPARTPSFSLPSIQALVLSVMVFTETDTAAAIGPVAAPIAALTPAISLPDSARMAISLNASTSESAM